MRWRYNIQLSKEDIEILKEVSQALLIYKEYFKYQGKVKPFTELVDRIEAEYVEEEVDDA